MKKKLNKHKIGDTIQFGGYDWLVLEVKNDKMLILSNKVIENRRYHNIEGRITWAKCELHYYLNNEFYNMFNIHEKMQIIETCITTNNNPWFETEGGNMVNDKIFLLSIEEVVKYFGDSGDLKNRKGWYWDNNELILKDENGYYLNDQYNNERIAKDNNGMASWWWLRSPGNSNLRVVRVRDVGTICVHGSVTRGLSCAGGIRPALWLNQ